MITVNGVRGKLFPRYRKILILMKYLTRQRILNEELRSDSSNSQNSNQTKSNRSADKELTLKSRFLKLLINNYIV